MSDTEETASNDPNSPERERSRSPRNHLPPVPPPPPPPPPPPQVVEAAVNVVGELARRTCPVCMRLFDSAKAMWGHSWVHRERQQIYAMNPPLPPLPPPPGATNGSVVAVSGGVAAAGWHPWKIDSRDERDRTCPKCFKIFGSPKAMYGHLHVHYEKGPKNVKPNPVVAGPSSAPAALALPPRPENGDENGDKADSPGTSIDLNRLPLETDEEDDQDDGMVTFDLNMTPPSR